MVVPFGYCRSSDLSPLNLPRSPSVLFIISPLAFTVICKSRIPGVTSIEKPDGKDTTTVLLLTELFSIDMSLKSCASLKYSMEWWEHDPFCSMTVMLMFPVLESSNTICAVSLVFVFNAKPEKTVALDSPPSLLRGRSVLPCKCSKPSSVRIKT